eukprot:1712694-Amphidinium_carterae.1
MMRGMFLTIKGLIFHAVFFGNSDDPGCDLLGHMAKVPASNQLYHGSAAQCVSPCLSRYDARPCQAANFTYPPMTGLSSFPPSRELLRRRDVNLFKTLGRQWGVCRCQDASRPVVPICNVHAMWRCAPWAMSSMERQPQDVCFEVCYLALVLDMTSWCNLASSKSVHVRNAHSSLLHGMIAGGHRRCDVRKAAVECEDASARGKGPPCVATKLNAFGTLFKLVLLSSVLAAAAPLHKVATALSRGWDAIHSVLRAVSSAYLLQCGCLGTTWNGSDRTLAGQSTRRALMARKSTGCVWFVGD